MTVTYTSADDELHSTRSHTESTLESEHDSRGVETSGNQDTFPTRLLGANLLRRRGNTTMRASVMQQAQHLHGNRAVQRFIQRSSGDALPVQRSPWSDFDPRPMCPLIPVGPELNCKPWDRGGGGEPTKQPPVSPSPGKNKKNVKPPKPNPKLKGHKGKPGETDDKGGFTMTLEDLIRITGHNPLEPMPFGRGGLFGGRDKW